MRLLALAMLLGLLCYTQAAPSKAQLERILQLLEKARGGRPGGPPGGGRFVGLPPGLLDSEEDDDDDGDDSDPRGGGPTGLIMSKIHELEERVEILEDVVLGEIEPPPEEEGSPPPEEEGPTGPDGEGPPGPDGEGPPGPPKGTTGSETGGPPEETPDRRALKRNLYRLLQHIK